MTNSQENYNKWLNLSSKKLIHEIPKNLDDKQIISRFGTKLLFGTAGIRAIMGYGSSELNEFNVIKVAKSYVNFLRKKFPAYDLKKYGVVIFHDNRLHSKNFAKIMSRVFTSENIKSMLAPNNDLKPTPMLSYVVREVQALGGAMITASHNPKEYNGIKLYNNYGAQYLPIDTNEIEKFMAEIDEEQVAREKFPGYGPLESEIPEIIFDKYLFEIKRLAVNGNLSKLIKIIFTPHSGTTGEYAKNLLTQLGYEVIVVKEQFLPATDFNGYVNINPEDVASFQLAETYAFRNEADLILACDPDGDRLGVSVYDIFLKKYRYLTGNEIAYLIFDYLLECWNQFQSLQKSHFALYSTFVSSDFVKIMAKENDINYFETPTGFKWIADALQNADKKFLFGYEEAIGFLFLPIVRDKDGLQGIVFLSDMLNYWKHKKKNVVTRLQEIYKKYGESATSSYSIKLKTSKDKQKIDKLFTFFRENQLKKIGNISILNTINYENFVPQKYRCKLFKFFISQESWFAIRPSGTEPKIKIYFYLYGEVSKKIDWYVDQISKNILKLLETN